MKHSMKAFFALICLLSANSAYAGVLENDELKVLYSDNRGYLISAMKKGDREPLNISAPVYMFRLSGKPEADMLRSGSSRRSGWKRTTAL